MADKPDPDRIRGPGGMTMREVHERVEKSLERDRRTAGTANKLRGPHNRWQRFVRYVWDRKKGR